MANAKELDGLVAIVTGSSRNIGKAIAQTLSRAGAKLAINARSSEAAARDVVGGIQAHGGDAMLAMADVTDSEAVARMVASVMDAWGRVDILVNNANVHGVKSFDELTYEDWRGTMAIALDAVFHCTKACYPLLKRHGGSIVNIGGSAGHMPYEGRVPVSSAKAGVAGMTRALAREAAAHGINVNCIAPGPVNTIRHAPSKSDPTKIPLGRFAEPDEVAHVVQMLCSPKGRYITGQTIHVNGGLYMNN